MNCFYHINTPAVAQCGQCGKFLCKECAVKYSPIICEDCFSYNDYKQKKSKSDLYQLSKKIFIATFAFFLVCGIFSRQFSLFYPVQVFAAAMGAAGIPYGWKKLEMKPDTFLIMPIIGWAVYYLVKFAIANIIGWIFFLPDLIADIQNHLGKRE